MLPRWARILRCKGLGRHGRAPDDGWGHHHGDDFVTLFCGGCGASYSTVSLAVYINRAEVLHWDREDPVSG